jgi:hypothetical protein
MATETSSAGPVRVAKIAPRFGLRALLGAVVVVAVLVQLGKVYWPSVVRFVEARQYARLQAGEEAFVIKQRKQQEKDGSFSASIDKGRPVPDNFVILVRRGDVFGCFIPRKQGQKGESLEYDWYFRTDGQGRFAKGDLNVQSGHAFAGPYVSGGGLVRVKFGPFDFEWSGHGTGWGYLYYDEGAVNQSVAADHQRVCATNVKTVEYLDAREAQWLYKAYVEDAGVPGNKDCNAPVPRTPRKSPMPKSPAVPSGS